MRWLIFGVVVFVGCRDDMNAQYCGIVNQGMRGPVVIRAKSQDCDIVLVDSCGTVIGIPGKYPIAKALCASLGVGDTVTVKGEVICDPRRVHGAFKGD